MSNNIIQTSRLLLRPIKADDIQHIYHGLSHPEVIRYYGVSFDSLEATQEQMTWFAQLEQEQTGRWWAVCSADDLTFYGAGGFCDWDHTHRKAEIGFWLIPDYWGKGIMKEAMPLICQYGFKEMKLHRIEGFVDARNSNCKRAMAKVNFVHEGTMQDCEVKDGTFLSLDIFACLSQY